MSEQAVVIVKPNDKKTQVIAIASSSIELLEKIQYTKGLTIYGTIGSILSKEETVNSAASLATNITQLSLNKYLVKSQSNRLNWFEKNIYISNHKKQKLESDREVKLVVAGVTAQLSIHVGAYFLKIIANKKEKDEFIKRMYGIVSFAAQEKGTIPEYNEPRISLILDIFEVSIDKTKRLVNSMPKNIIEVTPLKLDASQCELRETVAFSVYEVLSNRGVTHEEILKKYSILFEKIGFLSSEVEDFLNKAKDCYKTYKCNISNHYISVQQVVRDIAMNLNLSKQEILDNAMLLSKLDPYKEARERNIYMLKSAGQLAMTLGATAYTGPVADAAIIAAYAFSQKFFGNKELVQSSFSKVLQKHNLSEKEQMYISEAKQIMKAI